MNSKYSIRLTHIDLNTGDRYEIYAPTTNESISNDFTSLYNMAVHPNYVRSVLNTTPACMIEYIPEITCAEDYNIFSFLMQELNSLDNYGKEIFESILTKENDFILAAVITLTNSYWYCDFGDDSFDECVLLNNLSGMISYPADLMNEDQLLDKLERKCSESMRKFNVEKECLLSMIRNSLDILYYSQFDELPDDRFYNYED